jgi:Sulfotransferase domain
MTTGGAGQLPNLVIAGVSKGGTTSLFRYLAQHPDVCPSDVKEVRYFEPLRYGEPVAPIESYARHFEHCAGQRYRMEGTPSYFGGGRPVASAVRETLGDDARVLVCLREPVRRCWSWYQFVRGRARIPKAMGFEEYLDICEELHSAGLDGLRENQPWSGLLGGCYDQWIEAWQELFGGRLRILFFDDLVADPRSAVVETLRWLEVDERPAADFGFTVENRSVQYRSRPVLAAALVVNRRFEPFLARHGGAKRILRSAYHVVNRSSGAEAFPPGARDRLTSFYETHNDRLAATLRSAGISRLPAWLSRSPV